MRRTLPLIIVLAFVALGCKGSREKDVVGTWTGSNITVTATEDKKFTSTVNSMLKIDGTWAVDGNDVTFTPTSMAGKPIAEVKSAMAASAKSNPQAKQFVDNIDTPNIMTLTDDGKSMSTNKEKDKNPGPAMTLTKS